MIAIRCQICNGTGKLLYDPKRPLDAKRKRLKQYDCDCCEKGVVVLWRKASG